MKMKKTIAGRSSKYLEEGLYKRIFRSGSTPVAVRAAVDQFLKSRKRVYKWEVDATVKLLRERGRFRPALKLAEIMAKRGMNPTPSNRAICLDLVAKSRDIASAEKYFIALPEPAKNHLAYGSLLNCYCKELMTEKAEALMEKMKELGFASTSMAYNSLMTLYSKTKQTERIPSIIQEMKANDVTPDCFTYNIWMRSLAAVNDINGVERVIEEMKEDGRVSADWTTYSNLASIYVDAGMFQKAEEALKELEYRSRGHMLEASQFLITLYGRTGNLVQVYRVWRSLKLAYRRLSNISYLNMIQVLVNLKDLPGAESCFKEWESKRADSNYDIRVANALLKGYCQEDMFVKAEDLKKQAKKQGGRLNSKTWEILMDYHRNKGDMKSVLYCVDRGIKKGRSHGRPWGPPTSVVCDLMSYFEGKKDVEGAEKFIVALKTVKEDWGAEVFEALVRTYKAAGKKSPGMRRRLKMENVVVSEEIMELLKDVNED